MKDPVKPKFEVFPVEGAFAAAWDVTEREQAGEALRESEEKFRELAESIADVFFAMDEELRYTYWNKASEELTGVVAKDALGKHLYDIFSDLEMTRKAEKIYLKALRTQQVQSFVNEYQLGGKDYFFEISAYPSKKGLSVFVKDITGRKRMEEALRESEEKYRALVENAPNIVVVYQDGHFKFVNRAACNRLGWTYEELTSPSFGIVEKLVSEGSQHIVRENIVKRLRGEDVPPYEISMKTRDGSEFPVLVRGATISYGGKSANQIVFGDLTERKQAEKKARELQLLKEVDNLRHQLLSNVSHELRTPLTSIKGFVSTLLRTDTKWSEEEQRDFLETINQESDRLTRLINDLLDMSRIDAGALKLDKDYCHISEILESIDVRLAILTEYHRLDIKVPSELPRVFVDKRRIGQVLTNMVDNATKYSSGGSEITIEVKPDGNEIIVSVADKGQGIPAELLDKIFDRFYQAESIVTGRKRGTGLGLSICRGIVQAHNGRLWVESKVGEGSKFSFSLPVTKGEEQVAQDSSH